MRGSRRPKPSMNPRPPPPSTPLDHFRHRDSDASFASTRPSSIGIGGGSISNVDLYKDRSYQLSAFSAINFCLSSHSLQVFLKFPILPAREITEALELLVARLDWPSPKLEDDLPIILKSLKLKVLQQHTAELEAELEALEREGSVLEKDVSKFREMIENLDKNVKKLQKVLEEKERALEAKREEKKRILQKNE